MPEETSELRPSEEFFAFAWETLKIVFISLAIIIPIRYYLIQPFFVKGQSMEPDFHDKDYILVDKLSYRFSPPQRGDVIVFRYPRDPREYFIKRIIALPGETVEIKNNRIMVYNVQFPDGFIVDESGYLPRDEETRGALREKLDDDDYFVLGDNRLHSSDSRTWGLLHRSYVSGRAWLRLWPLDQILAIPRVTYAPVSP